MPRQIFKGRVISAAGPLPGQLTVDNLKRWTSLRKGTFSTDFTEETTHLLCTEEQFRKRAPRVKQGLKQKKLHIVHCDWFEFSTVENKKLPEKQYSMREIIAHERAIEREKARIEKGKRDGERFVNTNFYHIYQDRLHFPYQIDITRDDETKGEHGQRYTLCLWESNAKPHLYWFTAKFLKRKGDSQPRYYRPSPCPRKWRPEIDLFMEFFEKKTGIAWEDRVLKQGTTPLSAFQYAPPTGGKPVGRRLCADYDRCREMNAQLRGLPWPPPEESGTTNEDQEFEETPDESPEDESPEEEPDPMNILWTDANDLVATGNASHPLITATSLAERPQANLEVETMSEQSDPEDRPEKMEIDCMEIGNESVELPSPRTPELADATEKVAQGDQGEEMDIDSPELSSESPERSTAPTSVEGSPNCHLQRQAVHPSKPEDAADLAAIDSDSEEEKRRGETEMDV